MAERRRPSQRIRESAASRKRRFSSSPSPSPSPEPPRRVVPQEVREEGLPVRVEDGRSLPVLSESQGDDLLDSQYQSIAESGVLAASMLRSRQKWLTEGIFEKYWTKPGRRKPHSEVRNPSKESMNKLGPCTMVVEPHSFEVMLYTIRDAPSQHISPAPSYPQQRPVLQYGPPQGSTQDSHSVVGPYPQPQTPSSIRPLPSPYQSGPPAYPTPPLSSHQPPPPSPYQSQVGDPSTEIPQSQPIPAASQPTPDVPTTTLPAAPNPSPGAPLNVTAAPQGADPVIQMLATRAATNSELKSLMKVVASGSASPAQLKVFQSHIDELTVLSKAKTAEIRDSGSNGKTANGGNASSQALSGSQAPSQASAPSQADSQSKLNSFAPPQPPLLPNGGRVDPQTSGHGAYSSGPPMVKPRGPPPANKSPLKAVVFEFVDGSGDRFRFPQYSILDYHPNRMEVISSFLVVRKGSSSTSRRYDARLDYYQPVTMRLVARNPRILEPLARVVVGLEEARRYMNDVMDHTTPAEYVYLAMRLPRGPDDRNKEGMESSGVDEDEIYEREMQDLYAPSSSDQSQSQRSGRHGTSPDESSEQGSASPEPSAANKPKRVKRSRLADPNKRCHFCQTKETSLWRKAEADGQSVAVCNPCGIKWKAGGIRAVDGGAKKPRSSSKPTVVTFEQDQIPAADLKAPSVPPAAEHEPLSEPLPEQNSAAPPAVPEGKSTEQSSEAQPSTEKAPDPELAPENPINSFTFNEEHAAPEVVMSNAP